MTPIHNVLPGAGASAKNGARLDGTWSAHVMRATRPEEVSP